MTKKEKDLYVKNSQFYTKIETAKKWIRESVKFLKDNNISTEDVLFIEPSAGSGNFYFNIPKEYDKVAFDLYPVEDSSNWCIEQDFLALKEIVTNKKVLFFIGNPPFNKGLALSFINHIGQTWGDKQIIIGFILPGGYNIDNSVNRVKKINKVNNFSLFINKKLDNDSFVFPNGEFGSMVTVFQIYSNMKNIVNTPLKVVKESPDISKYVEVVHINSNLIKKTRWIKDANGNRVWEYVKDDNGEFVKVSTGVKYIDIIDCYLPMNAYESKKDKYYVYDTFAECDNNIGFGFIIKQDREKIIKILKETDWYSLTHQLTNMSNSISKRKIIEYLNDKIK